MIAFVYTNLIKQNISMKENHPVSLSNWINCFLERQSFISWRPPSPQPGLICSWQFSALILESGNVISLCCCCHCLRANLSFASHAFLRQNVILVLLCFSFLYFFFIQDIREVCNCEHTWSVTEIHQDT